MFIDGIEAIAAKTPRFRYTRFMLKLPSRTASGPFLALLLGLVTAPPVAANSSKVNLSFNDRNLTLPDGVIRIDGGSRWPYYDAQFKHIEVNAADFDFLNPGITFSPSDELDLGVVTPIRLSPDFDLEDPRVHLLYQLQSDSELELAIFAQLRLGFFDEWAITGGVPLYWHFKPNMRLDAGGFVRFAFGDASRVDLTFPVQLSIQLSKRLYAGPETGLNINSLFDDGSNVSLPLGGFIGYTIGSSGAPLGDLYARVRLLDLEFGFDGVELMLGTELFFDM